MYSFKWYWAKLNISNRWLYKLSWYCFSLLGGLLICMQREEAAKYCTEIKKIEGHQAWIIGIVEKGEVFY